MKNYNKEKKLELFDGDDSDCEGKLGINNGYATVYNDWRGKEELNKLKTKYGEDMKDLQSSNDESESSSEDDEDANELTEDFEKNFYKTLACLKKKDPKIYDKEVAFFPKSENDDNTTDKEKKKKSKNEKSLFLRDYERKIVTERGGKFSDSEDEDEFHQKNVKSDQLTYVEEQRQLKESIKKALSDEEDDGENSGLLKPKSKSEIEKQKEEENYKEWLKGQKEEIQGPDKEELKPLRDFWTDPKLDSKEKFLRDYILNKKFLDKDNEFDLEYEERIHDSDENLSEDEKNIVKQEEFEHKFNYRFEEPDQDFIKRYPRTMENSLRKKDTRRAQKRVEVKQRKEEEKIRKREELKQLKALKRKEITDKIAQLKEITGNDDMNFDAIDLDGDFDPAEHDRKMQELFNEEYYEEGDNEVAKPEFPDLDEELEIESTWDDYVPNSGEIDTNYQTETTEHCEDENFNMDADYDANKAQDNELAGPSRKKRRRRSKFAEMIAKEKPKFDPSVHSTYKDYINQYYALDYEDMIGDIPCRFKYRNVVPNDYGLTVEEIMMADDRELNRWCSLKKALEHKSERQEMNEVRTYQLKSKNEDYKKKILQSLYKPLDEPENGDGGDNPQEGEGSAKQKKRKRNKKKGTVQTDTTESPKVPSVVNENTVAKEKSSDDKSVNNKKRKADGEEISIKEESMELKGKKANTVAIEKSSDDKSVNNKKRKSDGEEISIKEESSEPKGKKAKTEDPTDMEPTKEANGKEKKKKKNKKGNSNNQQESNDNLSKKAQRKEKYLQLKKSKNKEKSNDPLALTSDERLKAYKINPKKFKNKLKYGKK